MALSAERSLFTTLLCVITRSVFSSLGSLGSPQLSWLSSALFTLALTMSNVHQVVGRSVSSPTVERSSGHQSADHRAFKRVISAAQAVAIINKAERRSVGQTHRPQLSLLDARDLSPKYYWSRARGALHTPWRDFTVESRSGVLIPQGALQKRVRALGLSPEQQIIIYGEWERGWGEEARMLWLLEYLGHKNVYVVEGGWAALKSAQVQTSWGRTPTIVPSSWEVQPRPELRVDTEKAARLVSTGHLSIDARSRREFEGETPYGSSYGGHLKESVHLPWRSLLTADHHLRSSQELKAIFLSLGVLENQPVFTYCTGGVRSAFIYLALHEAGFDEAMNYDGSWWDWTLNYTADAHPLIDSR